MEKYKPVARTLTGLSVICAGILLLCFFSHANDLLPFLHRLGPMKVLVPYYRAYYTMAASLFLLSGALAFMHSRLAAITQAVGCGMFVLTVDNPFMYQSCEQQAMRSFFVLCQIGLVVTLWILGEERKERVYKKA